MFNDFSSLVLVGSSVEGASGVEHLIEIGYFLPRKEGIINQQTDISTTVIQYSSWLEVYEGTNLVSGA